MSQEACVRETLRKRNTGEMPTSSSENFQLVRAECLESSRLDTDKGKLSDVCGNDAKLKRQETTAVLSHRSGCLLRTVVPIIDTDVFSERVCGDVPTPLSRNLSMTSAE